MEELELLNIPGFGSIGVILKIDNKTAKKVSAVKCDQIYNNGSISYLPNWIQEINKKLKKKKKINIDYDTSHNIRQIHIITEEEEIFINLENNSKNYIWLFDDD